MLTVALEEINNSQLSKTTRANALALLNLAHADNGHVMLSWQQLTTLFGVSVSRSRRHLGDLQQANVIHYSSNGDGIVYVNFKAWARAHAHVRNSTTDVSKNDNSDAEKRAPTRVSATDDSSESQETRVGARNMTTELSKNARGRAFSGESPIRVRARALTDRLTDQLDQPSTVSQSVTAPADDDRRRTLDLLRAIRIESSHAARIAAAHPFERVRDCVASWWMNRKSAGGRLDNTPGIVLYWLDNWPDKPPNSYDTAEWRRSDLYRMHRTPQELAAGDPGDQNERANLYIPDEFVGIANRFEENDTT